MLSHRSAATLWEITPRWRGPVEVTARIDRRRPGIQTHRSSTLTPAETTVHYGTTGPTRSRFEDRFLRFVEPCDLPRPEVNQSVAGYEGDMLSRDERLIVELDGRTFHRHTFEEDRERDAHHLRAGFATLRITWRRLTSQPDREARRLRRC